jgi:hypothetical protein
MLMRACDRLGCHHGTLSDESPTSSESALSRARVTERAIELLRRGGVSVDKRLGALAPAAGLAIEVLTRCSRTLPTCGSGPDLFTVAG